MDKVFRLVNQIRYLNSVNSLIIKKRRDPSNFSCSCNMIIFLSISCVIIQHCMADHASKAEKERPDTWLVTAISIGASAILLLIMLLCCCCCSFCRRSKPNRNRFRRSSSFRFNRTSAPTAPIAMEEIVEINEEGPHSSQISDANNILNDNSSSEK